MPMLSSRELVIIIFVPYNTYVFLTEVIKQNKYLIFKLHQAVWQKNAIPIRGIFLYFLLIDGHC